MSRYTLKTFCGVKELEKFEHRSAQKLQSILSHPRMDRAGQTGPWGEPEDHPDRFEIRDSLREKLFEGNINDVIAFVKGLK